MTEVSSAVASRPGGDDPAPDPVASFGPTRFLNRELSWLDFAERVLELAQTPDTPLLERAKFLAIFSNGLDEFFQVRVAGLKNQAAAGLRQRSPDGRSVREQLADVRVRASALVERAASIYTSDLHPALAAAGILIAHFEELDEVDRAELRARFERDIFPVLTPLAVDPGHPFPYISNLSMNLAVIVEDAQTGESRFARVKVPPLLPRFVPLSGEARFVPLEQVIAAHLDYLFPDMRIGAHYTFRVTRNADLDLEDSEADDLLEAVELELRRRRFGRAVRLELEPRIPDAVRELLMSELELEADDVYLVDAPLDLSELFAIVGLDRPELHDPDWIPTTQPRLARQGDEPVDLFAVLRDGDVLVHHPYDSFATSVEAFISQAADDPDVLAIKQTLYRTSGDASFVAALARAAEAGKQVAALVEVKARFDEQRNIAWARQLEQAGVHVVYGIMGLKTHSKTALVVRREPDGIRRYCHVGTGNYNSDTARVYEDLGLLSADPDLGADLTDLFNHLTGFSRSPQTRSLILSPERFRPWVLGEIETERRLGPAGRIAIKVNGLIDPEIIDALYRASLAGVEIDLIVRGLCALRPGVPGLSEHIRVRSIVGRFLEHSRIFRFGDPERIAPDGGGARYVIGSGDLMERNLDRRIEALVPVRDRALCERLEEILRLSLDDDANSWTLGADGDWARVPRGRGLAVQSRLAELALERAHQRVHHESVSG